MMMEKALSNNVETNNEEGSFTKKLRLKSVTPSIKIDNSRNIYIPFWLSCGVQIYCRFNVLMECPKILYILDSDLRNCLKVLPLSVRKLILRIKIWVNLRYECGDVQKPNLYKHCTTHHTKEWLLRFKDNPKKAPGIEIYDCREYLRMRRNWNGHGLILHEIFHVIHQFVLPNGLENETVKEAFLNSRSSPKYSKVFRRDWADRSIQTDKAYATINHKEFFAEFSVAYLSDNFHDLDDQYESFEDCCPPFPPDPIACSFFYDYESANFPHCNKFYPFTRGQFLYHDPLLYQTFEKLWDGFINSWVDKE